MPLERCSAQGPSRPASSSALSLQCLIVPTMSSERSCNPPLHNATAAHPCSSGGRHTMPSRLRSLLPISKNPLSNPASRKIACARVAEKDSGQIRQLLADIGQGLTALLANEWPNWPKLGHTHLGNNIGQCLPSVAPNLAHVCQTWRQVVQLLPQIGKLGRNEPILADVGHGLPSIWATPAKIREVWTQTGRFGPSPQQRRRKGHPRGHRHIWGQKLHIFGSSGASGV